MTTTFERDNLFEVDPNDFNATPNYTLEDLLDLKLTDLQDLTKVRGISMRGRLKNKRGYAGAIMKWQETEQERDLFPKSDVVTAALADLVSRPDGLKKEARKTITPTHEVVTPELAAEWLSTNLNNRDLRKERVTRLAGILVRGEWECSQDGIGFDTNGKLLNGQHRLVAILISGVSAEFIVVRGMRAESMEIMDTGLSRNVGDSLKRRGIANHYVVGAALGWHYRFNYIETTGKPHYGASGNRPTPKQLLSILDNHPGLLELKNPVVRMKKELPVRTGMFIALWYRLRQIDAEDADVFVERLASGANMDEDDPILVLRNQLHISLNRGNGVHRMEDWREAALIIKGWNAYRDGRTVDRLAYKYGGIQRELFPTPY